MITPSRRKPAHVLANAPFRRLWLAISVGSLGDWLNVLALTALAANLTQGLQAQPLAIGGVFLAMLLPPVLLAPLAGAFADRFDRRLTMLAADLLRFALVLSAALIGSYQWVIAAAFLIACVNLFWLPAKDATVPNLVPKDRLAEANRLNSLVLYGTAPLAALLFALVALTGDLFMTGTTLVLLLSAATCLISAGLVYTLGNVPRRTVFIPEPGVIQQIAKGRHGNTPLVNSLIFAMLGTLTAAGAVIGVAKIYAGALGGGDPAYGMLAGAVCVGMALGLFFGPRLLGGLSRIRLFGLVITAAGIALIAVALVRNLPTVVMLSALLGACTGIAWTTGYALIGKETDEALHRRTYAFLHATARVTLLLVLTVATPLADLLNMPFTQTFYRFDGSNLVVVLGGVFAVVVGLLALRRLDDRKGIPLAADLMAALRGERFEKDEPVEQLPGVFIAFEGGEGSGKTTQSRMLAIWLRDQGFDVVQTREPGATKVGMRLRAILLDAAEKGLSARSEALLYAADRAEHVEKVIRPALVRGSLVITDRYVDSSLAYQGAGRALDPTDVATVNAWATDNLVPDLTVLIDTPPEIGLTRLGGAADRIEAEPLEFHQRVRNEFRKLASAAPDRYLVVDGTLEQREITRVIQDKVREILPDPVPEDSEDATGTMPAIRD